MKHLCLIVVLCLSVCLNSLAQQTRALAAIATPESTPEWINIKPELKLRASELASQHKGAMELTSKDELQLLSVETDQIGYTHYRYQQVHKGIPVEGAVFLIHEKAGRIVAANGRLVPNLDLAKFDFFVSEEQALLCALEQIGAQQYAWQNGHYEANLRHQKNDSKASFYPKAEKVIVSPDFHNHATNYRLAYKFDIYASQPLSRQDVYIDAEDGSLITSLNRICTGAVPCTAHAAYNCTNPVPITATFNGIDYRLIDPIHNVETITINAALTDTMSIIEMDTIFDMDTIAAGVHYSTGKVFEYFFNKFQRNSIDDNGFKLLSIVHFGNNYNNAFWNGNWMVYGDGDGIVFTPLTSSDVVAHEITHGLTQFTANLIYKHEPGALNEGFSDIFATVIEHYIQGECADWLIGGDITVLAKALRNMAYPKDPDLLQHACNPTGSYPNTYQGDNWISGGCDNGGVHINSSVLNYWFYLLSEGGTGTNDKGFYYEVGGIGIEAAAAIAYRTLTTKLTPISQFSDARTGSIIAAAELIADEILTVDAFEQTVKAWCAVGIGACDEVPEWLKVTYPNGNESLYYNTIETLTWTSSNTIDAVQIEISIDGGATWLMVSDSTANDGSYEWLVPNMPTALALLRVQSLENPSIAAKSASTFTIIGCEVAAVFGFTNAAICQGDSVTFANMSVDADEFVWELTGATTLTDSSTDFTLAFSQSGVYTLTLTARKGVDCESVYSETFMVNVSPVATFDYVLYGLQGNFYADFEGADSYIWTADGDTIGVGEVLVHEFEGVNGHIYELCLKTMNECGETEHCSIVSLEDNCPNIKMPIQILFPNNGELLHAKDTIDILWETIGGIEAIKIQYAINGGATWTTLTENTPNTGSYEWILPDTVTQVAKVRVQAVENESVAGISRQPFSILCASTAKYSKYQYGKVFNFYAHDIKAENYIWTLNGLPFDTLWHCWDEFFEEIGMEESGFYGDCAIIENTSFPMLTHIFETEGIYEVCLAIESPCGNETHCENVEVVFPTSCVQENWKQHNSSHNIEALLDDGDFIWTGGIGGLVRWEKATKMPTKYTVLEGLPSNQVLALAKDMAGNIWVGTDRGVSKFDGVNFENFTTIEGLPNDTITALVGDNANNVWIGTVNGAAKYNGTTIDNLTSEPFLDNHIVACVVDGIGDVWLGTQYNGVVQYDGSEFTAWNTGNGFCGDWIGLLLPTPTGIWVYTENGLFHVEGGVCESHPDIPDTIRKAVVDNLGNLWEPIYDIDSLWVRKYNGVSFSDYVSSSMDDNFIGGSYYSGYLWSDPRLIDTEGNLWMGTAYYGLFKYDTTTHICEYFNEDDINTHPVSAFGVGENGSMWMGTKIAATLPAKLYQYLNEVSGFKNYGIMNFSRISNIEVIGDSVVWIGGNHGFIINNGGLLSKFNRVANSFEYFYGFGTTINDLIIDNSGNIFIATSDSLSIYKDGNFENFDLEAQQFIEQDAENFLIGTADGFYQYQEGGLNNFILDTTSIPFIDGIYSPLDRSILYLDKAIWIVSSGVILKYSNEASYVLSTYDLGLGYLYITTSSIIDNLGNVWVGTTQGLLQFNGSTFRLFTTEDGLPYNEVTALEIDTEGKLWVATKNGSGIGTGIAVLDLTNTPYFTIPQAICTNQSITFQNTTRTSGTVTYEWWLNDTLFLDSGTDLSYTFNQAGDYILTLVATYEGGCSNAQSRAIYVSPEANMLPITTEYMGCDSPPYFLEAGSSDMEAYTWFFEGNMVSHDPVYMAVDFGFYTLEVADYCGNVHAYTIEVLQNPDCPLKGDLNEDGRVNYDDLRTFGLELGNGNIEEGDLAAVLTHYSDTTTGHLLASPDNSSPISVEAALASSPYLAGDSIIALDIYLEDTITAYNWVMNGYYTLTGAATINKVTADFSRSWLGIEGIESASMHQHFVEENAIEIAATRWNQQNKVGTGVLATLFFELGIDSSTTEPIELTWDISGIETLHLDGTSVSVAALPQSFTLYPNTAYIGGTLPMFEATTSLCAGTTEFFENNSLPIGLGVTVYEWYVNDNLQLTTETSNDFSYEFIEAGSYIVTLKATNENGCHETQSQIIEVYPNASDIAIDSTYQACLLEPLVLNAGGGMKTYNWFHENGATVPPLISTTQICTISVSGTYKLRVYDYCSLEFVDYYIEVLLDPDCVWPGDFNKDGIVNHLDVLTYGLHYGIEGLSRPNASISWQGQPSPVWPDTTTEGTNLKHIDANGDGIINHLDWAVLALHYGNTHTDTLSPPNFSSPIVLNAVLTSAPTFGIGTQTVEIELFLEHTAGMPVTAYGIAMDVAYWFPEDIEVHSVSIDFSNSFLGTIDSSLYGLYKNYPSEQTVELGVTRFNHENKTGLGSIATLRAEIDLVTSTDPIPLHAIISGIRLITADGSFVPVAAPAKTFMLYPEGNVSTLEAKAFLEGAYQDALGLMPNPLLVMGLLPLEQPYSGAPWHYEGNERVLYYPDFDRAVVDWVLLEVRDAAGFEIIEQKAALLLIDGSIIDARKPSEGVQFYRLEEDADYRLIVRHRNHIAVMSAETMRLEEGKMCYDFTTSASQALGANQQIELSDGLFGLYGRDINADGRVTVSDENILDAFLPTAFQYLAADINMDGQVNDLDVNFYGLEPAEMGIEQIRYP